MCLVLTISYINKISYLCFRIFIEHGSPHVTVESAQLGDKMTCELTFPETIAKFYLNDRLVGTAYNKLTRCKAYSLLMTTCMQQISLDVI